MTAPAFCPFGQGFLNFPSQPAFNGFSYSENVGGTINSGDINIQGTGLGNPGFAGNYISIGKLKPDGLQVIAVFDFISYAAGDVIGTANGCGIGLGADTDGFASVYNSRGGLFHIPNNVSGGDLYTFTNGVSPGVHEISRHAVHQGTLYTNVKVTLTVSAIKSNENYDLTIHYENASAGLDYTGTLTDFFGALNPIRIVIVGPSIDTGSGYLDLKSLSIVGGELPFIDPTVSGVDPAWFITKDVSTPAIEQAGTVYRHINDAVNETKALAFIEQVLGGIPTKFQANVGLVSLNNLASTGLNIFQVSIPDPGGNGTSRVRFESEVSDPSSPQTTDYLLQVIDGSGSQEFQLSVFHASDSSPPLTNSTSGLLKIIPISGNNIQVYWNGSLVYISSNSQHSWTSQFAKIGLSRTTYIAGGNADIYGTIGQIEYDGVSVLPNNCPPASYPPTLDSPANAATNVSVAPTLFVTDNNSPLSDLMYFQVAIDSGFTGIIYQTSIVPATSLVGINVPPILMEDTIYYWRARAQVGVSYSDYSSVFSFTTTSFHLISPANHANIVNNLEPFLTWSQFTGADHYNIQVSVNADMSLPLINITRPSAFLGYHIPTPLTPGTRYYWRVGPIIETVLYTFTNTWDFTIAIPVLQAPFEGPNIMMRFSTDRGKTWSDEDWQEMGEPGSYAGRNRWVGLSSGYGICFWFRSVGDTYISWRSVRVRAQ